MHIWTNFTLRGFLFLRDLNANCFKGTVFLYCSLGPAAGADEEEQVEEDVGTRHTHPHQGGQPSL